MLDMRMPGMDGAELLTRVMKQHPQMVRLVLSGHSHAESVLRSVGPAHQYLSKPCDAETLKTTVGRALALQRLLSNETMRQVVSKMDSLPSLPSFYDEVLAELRSNNASIARIAIVEQAAGSRCAAVARHGAVGERNIAVSVKDPATCGGSVVRDRAARDTDPTPVVIDSTTVGPSIVVKKRTVGDE